MVFVNETLDEEKIFLQPRVLAFEFMYVIGAELQNLHLLSDSMEQSVSHEQGSGVDTKDDMFGSIMIDHRNYELKIKNYSSFSWLRTKPRMMTTAAPAIST